MGDKTTELVNYRPWALVSVCVETEDALPQSTRWTVTWVLGVLFVASCAPMEAESSPRPHPTVTSPPTSTTVSAPEPEEYVTRLHRVDVATLADICAFPPIEFDAGWYIDPVAYGNEAELALAIATSPGHTQQAVYLVDRDLWSATELFSTRSDQADIHWLGLHGEGEYVAWWVVDRQSWGSGELYRYDVADGRLEKVVSGRPGDLVHLDKTSAIWTATGRNLAMYRAEVGEEPELVAEIAGAAWELRLLPSGWIAALLQAGPQELNAVTVHPATGELAEVDLTGVQVGYRPVEGASGGPGELTEDLPEQLSWAASGTVHTPGLAWDPEGARLYVVHADEAAITEIDLEAMSSEKHQISREVSWINRLLAWLIPPAQAKAETPGEMRTGILSVNGSRLYVTGSSSRLVRDPNGDIGPLPEPSPHRTTASAWKVATEPIGVEVLDTHAMRVLAHTDLPISEIVISPDGRYLVGTGTRATETPSQADSGLRNLLYRSESTGTFVLDADALEVVAEFEPGTTGRIEGFSKDGRYVYLSAEERVLAFDLATLRVTGERTITTSLLEAGIVSTRTAGGAGGSEPCIDTRR